VFSFSATIPLVPIDPVKVLVGQQNLAHKNVTRLANAPVSELYSPVNFQ
jgi:hypothetical protein